MSYLNSDDLLDLLVRERLLTAAQRQFILLNQAKQRLKLLKHHGRRQEDEYRQAKGFPDLVDIILSLGLETADRPPQPISEEMIMLAVSRGFDIPFKKLDPLELDMNVVTKTIPRSFAIRHLILPISLDNGLLEVVTYYPDNQNALEDIERANQLTVRPYLSTKTDIRKILAEFFGFQRSITAAETQFGAVGAAAPVDIGNLEHYVRLASAKELSSTDQHIKAAVNHLFSYALSSGRATSTSNPSATCAWSASASTACSTPSTTCPRRCTRPSPRASRAWPGWTSPRSGGPRTAASRSAGARRTGPRRSACPPCRWPSARRR